MEDWQNNRSALIPAVLLIGLAGVLIIAAIVLLQGLEPPYYLQPATAQPTSPVAQALLASPLATSTATSSATSRPTWTIMPSRTPTITPTFTPTPTPTRPRVPTLTPALPNRINDLYALPTVSADLMDHLARSMGDLPDAKFRPLERNSAAYNAYFIYPAIAYREALLRFPQAQQALSWRWGLAYSLARLGDPEAVSIIQDFLLEALNQSKIPPAGLPAFLHKAFPDLTLFVHELDLPPEQPGLKLLEIPEGRMILLLWENLPGKFRLYPLKQAFEFTSDQAMVYTTLDLDGDNIKELVIYQAATPGDTTIARPLIFHLDPLPPAALDVQAVLPQDYKIGHSTAFSAVANANSSQSLQMTAVFYPSCPFSVTRRYDWDGNQVRLSGTEYSFQPQPELLSYCESLIGQAGDFWDTSARLEILRKLLPFWPPASDPQGRPYPKADQDKLRFELAVDLALNGEVVRANATLSELTTSPADPDGEWVTAAADFQRSLSRDGLYLACQTTPGCDLRAALRQILAESATNDPAQALAALQAAGTAIRSSGSLDFDQDGEDELWLTIQPRPLDKLEFWILARTPGGVRALWLALTDFSESKPYWSDAQVYPGVFQIAPRQGYRLQRLPDSQEPFIVPVAVEPILTTYTLDALLDAEKELLAGHDPAGVRDNLLAVLKSGRFNCKSDQICDRFTYILGLAYELSGDIRLARDTYIQLWWENRQSPLTTMARLKLVYLPSLRTPTPTRTLRPTTTDAPTRTPAPTGTPTPTPTP